MNKLIFDSILISFRLNFKKKCIVYVYIYMKMTQKQTLFVKGDVVCFVFNSLNYEATMTRTHYSSYKIYNLKNVKLIDGGNQMERANIKSSFITIY